jgi:hypothetical protein
VVFEVRLKQYLEFKQQLKLVHVFHFIYFWIIYFIHNHIYVRTNIDAQPTTFQKVHIDKLDYGHYVVYIA